MIFFDFYAAAPGLRTSHEYINYFFFLASRGGPANLDRFRGRDNWNFAGYAAAASG
jgi:hypothetical protein